MPSSAPSEPRLLGAMAADGSENFRRNPPRGNVSSLGSMSMMAAYRECTKVWLSCSHLTV